MDFNKINDTVYRPRFLAEFSMGQYDYIRIDKTLNRVDELCAMVTSVDLPSLELMQQYLAQLKNLYDNLRPIVFKSVADECDIIIKEAIKKKRLWENARKSGNPTSPFIIMEFVDLLNNFKTKLYDLKQLVGLGIVVKKNRTTKEKIRMGVRGELDMDDLPED